MRDFIVSVAFDVHMGQDFNEAVLEIVRHCFISRLQAEFLLETELQLIDMNIYLEGVYGVSEPHRTSCQIIH